ncbi:MAG: hypothetical protein OQK75_13340 [Gammaproteobacteria bacterium]|nr:hypothetical protein [Gammaproteobacteria bacterium]MCW8988642.1 hypothetical protein [Gammaproteobacteria bacterium]MCW9030492.1 hypothetical protein [Gammaproteobacteria bacterium]
MGYMNKNHIILLCLLNTSLSMASDAEFQMGGGLMYFNYAEYLDNNRFLDGETGFIPGVVLKRKQYQQNIYTELVGQLYGNRINYDGETWDGVPLKTDSVAIIIDTHLKVGMRLEQKHEPYIGLGYRYWYRNILSGYDANGAGVSGVLEEYYWPYWMFGFIVNINSSEAVKVGFDFRYTQMFDAKMDIDFLGYKGYDNTQVNLGNKSGARFAVPVKFKTRTNSLIVSPYYEIIDIGKSNVVGITKGGVPVTGCVSDPCRIYEPRSETRNVGIELTWLW